MGWFCNTKRAIEHKKNCKKNPWNCDKCVWIDESANAMGQYGKVVEKEIDLGEPHPLLDEIIDKFNGRIID